MIKINEILVRVRFYVEGGEKQPPFLVEEKVVNAKDLDRVKFKTPEIPESMQPHGFETVDYFRIDLFKQV